MSMRMYRRLRSGLVIVAASLAVVAAAATPAQAATFLLVSDGFENNPAATWWFESPGSGNGDFEPHDGTPHSGVTYAEIWRFDAGWNSVDRSVQLPSGLFGRSCTLRAFVQELPGRHFNIEVIDPANWTYVALRSFTLPDLEWRSYSLPWSGGPSSVVIRFVVTSTGGFARVKVDDVRLTCTVS